MGSSRSEEGGGQNGDAVSTAVGVGAGGDDRSVEKLGAEPLLEPMQVADVMVGDGSGQLDFQGDDSSVVSFDDQVDFLLAAPASLA